MKPAAGQNVYFHIAMAYAIMCYSGVDVDKMEFLDPINWIDAGCVLTTRAS